MANPADIIPGEFEKLTPEETEKYWQNVGRESEKHKGAMADYASKALDAAQTTMTGAGLIPGVGNIVDLLNAGVSTARAGYADWKGDEDAALKHSENAALNLASAVPVAGIPAGLAGLGKDAATYSGGMEDKSITSRVVGPDLVQLDNEYVQMQQRHKQEVDAINAQRAGRLQTLSDEEVYRQLYEQTQLNQSTGKLHSFDKGVMRPESSPYYPPSNQTLARPQVTPGQEQEAVSETQQRHDDAMGWLGGVPGGSPTLKAAQIMAQASLGAPDSKFKRSPVTLENLPVSESEWDTYEKNIDYKKGGHIGDMFGGKFPSHPKGHFGAARTRKGKLVKGAHMGQDYSTPMDTPLPAPSDGILSPHGTGSATSNQGWTIRFYGDDGHAHKFMHMNGKLNIKEIAKALGKELNEDGSLNVSRGDIIGYTGNSGWPSKGGRKHSTHLHHEVFELKEGQEHNYTKHGLDPGQTRYNHIDPRQWMRKNALAQATPGIDQSQGLDTTPSPAPVPAKTFKDQDIKPNADVLKFIEEMKKRNSSARKRG